MDSTPLAGRFDIEEWRDLMGAYYDTPKIVANEIYSLFGFIPEEFTFP